MHESIPPDSAIDPQVTNLSGVRCKQTSVSHLVVKLQSPYICRLVCRTPYACISAVDICDPGVCQRVPSKGQICVFV